MDYPNMWGYLRDLYQTSGIGETVDHEHIQKHYQVILQEFLIFLNFFWGLHVHHPSTHPSVNNPTLPYVLESHVHPLTPEFKFPISDFL